MAELSYSDFSAQPWITRGLLVIFSAPPNKTGNLLGTRLLRSLHDLYLCAISQNPPITSQDSEKQRDTTPFCWPLSSPSFTASFQTLSEASYASSLSVYSQSFDAFLSQAECKIMLECLQSCDDDHSEKRHETQAKYQHLQFPQNQALCDYECLGLMSTQTGEDLIECMGTLRGCMAPSDYSDEWMSAHIFDKNRCCRFRISPYY